MEKIYKEYWFSYMKKCVLITIPIFIFLMIGFQFFDYDFSTALCFMGIIFIVTFMGCVGAYFKVNEIKFFVNSQVNKTSKVNRVETVPEFEKTATQKIKRYVYNTEQPPETAGKGKKKKN